MGEAEKVSRKIASQEHGRGDVATRQTYMGYYTLFHTEIEEGAKIVNTSHALQIIIYYFLTSTYICLRVFPSELVRILF